MPLARRRLRIPAPVTVAATAAGPVGLAVLAPRSKRRDAALYVLHMWAYTMIHELPYDDPEALRRRLRADYPIRADRVLGLGELPNVRLQRALSPASPTALDRVLTLIHWAWFVEPHLAVAWILVGDERRFPRAARQMAAAFDLGCATYFAVPTAPPWWASEQRRTEQPVRRIMVEVGEETWGRAWPALYNALGGNPWAAMPSLHFGTSVLTAILLGESSRAAGALGWAYALSLGLALVHLGEHYVTDLLAGLALVAAVRRGEPLLGPAIGALSRVVQRLERVAAG